MTDKLECAHEWIVESMLDLPHHAGYGLVGRCVRCDQQRVTTLSYGYVMTLMATAQRGLDRLFLTVDPPK